MPTPLRILLVEDDPDTVGVVRLLIERVAPDAQVDPCSSLRVGVESLALGQHDLVITDIGLPDEQRPLEVLRALRDVAPAHARVVVMSGLSDPSVAKAVGTSTLANGFIAKGGRDVHAQLSFTVGDARGRLEEREQAKARRRELAQRALAALEPVMGARNGRG